MSEIPSLLSFRTAYVVYGEVARTTTATRKMYLGVFENLIGCASVSMPAFTLLSRRWFGRLWRRGQAWGHGGGGGGGCRRQMNKNTRIYGNCRFLLGITTRDRLDSTQEETRVPHTSLSESRDSGWILVDSILDQFEGFRISESLDE